jgi:hypothetical protein
VLFHRCASLGLHLYQVVKGFTLELSNMLGTPKEGAAEAAPHSTDSLSTDSLCEVFVLDGERV